MLRDRYDLLHVYFMMFYMFFKQQVRCWILLLREIKGAEYPVKGLEDFPQLEHDLEFMVSKSNGFKRI